MRKLLLTAVASSVLLAGAPGQAASLISANLASISSTGTFGVLRAGSIWAPASAPAPLASIVDDAFVPEGQTWTEGSMWWDQDASVNAAAPYIDIVLSGPVSFNSFTVQADDNDSYLLQYWDGAAWQTAWAIDPVFSFGLVTRTSGILPSFTTDRLRFSATGGDNYYGVSEIQGFGTAVPEPAAWALMIAGFAAAGSMMRRRTTARLAVRA